MTSKDFKMAPPLGDPEEDMENVAAKVKVLEACITNLADRVAADTKSIKEDIKSLKPSHAQIVQMSDRIPKIPIFIQISSRLWFLKGMTLDVYHDIPEILNIPDIPEIPTIPEIPIIINISSSLWF